MIPGILRTVNKINAEKKVRKQCEIDKEQLVEIQAVFVAMIRPGFFITRYGAYTQRDTASSNTDNDRGSVTVRNASVNI